MTNQERAEKIVNEYFNGDNGKNTSLYDKILSQLDEVCVEALSKQEPFNQGFNIGYEKGFASAKEQAAGIAQQESNAYAGKALLASDACKDVAERIRGMSND